MKLIVSSLTFALLLSGCTQPKNRLADEKNLDFQKRMAAKKPQAKPSELVIVDVKPPVSPQADSTNNGGAVAANPSQQPQIQLPPTVEPADEPKGNAPATTPPPAATAPAPKPAAPAPSTPAAPKQAEKKPEVEASKPSQTSNANKNTLTEEEQKALYQALAANGVNSNDAFKELFTVKLGDIKSPSLALSVQNDDFSAQIRDGENVVTQFEGAKLDKSGKAVKVDALNGFKATLICVKDCAVLFFGLSKEENGSITINLPAVLKMVDGQYIMAKAPQKNVSETAPSPTAQDKPIPAAPAPSASSAAAEKTNQDEVFVEFDDLEALYATFAANQLGSQEDVAALFSGIYPEPDSLGFKVEGSADEFNLQATHGPKIITEVKKLKLDKTGKASVVESSNGFRLITMCAKECVLVYAAFLKVAGEKLEANLPILLKNAGGQYKSASMRSAEHYKQEAEKKKSVMQSPK